MVYLDNAATSRPREEAIRAYEEVSLEHFGNPSSVHGAGYDAERYLRKARDGVLSSFAVSSTHKCVFTSGASEANNIFITGIAHRFHNRGNRLITSLAEHPSVLRCFLALKDEGYDVVLLPVGEKGAVAPEELAKAMNDKTILVSLMGVNNETGALSDLMGLRDAIRRFPKCFFHSDLTQAVGKLDEPFALLDAFTFSGHKIGSLKGSGALVYRKTIDLPPLLHGGEQEGGVRPGTVDVASAYALSVALALARKEERESGEKAALLRSKLVSYLLSRPDEFVINSPFESSPFLLSFSLLKKKAAVYVEGLSEKGIYVSSVSACSSKRENVSSVVLAMGLSKERAAHAVRVSFAPYNTLGDIDAFIKASDELLKGLINQR